MPGCLVSNSTTPKVRAAAIFGATTLMEMYDGEASGFYGTETFDPRYLYDWTHKKSDREKVLGSSNNCSTSNNF